MLMAVFWGRCTYVASYLLPKAQAAKLSFVADTWYSYLEVGVLALLWDGEFWRSLVRDAIKIVFSLSTYPTEHCDRFSGIGRL